jgi:hypothetical protein
MIAVDHLIAQAKESITRRPNRSYAGMVIDSVYSIFTDEIYHICDKYFDQYDPQAVKTTADRTLGIDDNSSHSQVTRAFKRSQRHIAASNTVKSRDPAKTPLTEAFEHYSKVFSERAVGFEEDPEDISMDFLSQPCFQLGSMVKQVVKSYPTAKSGGPDRIHTVLLKVLIRSERFHKNLVALYQLFIFAGVTPKSWNVSVLHLLLKDKDAPYADKTRPIALTQILRRFFESCIYRCFVRDKKQWMQTCSIQHGFKRGFGVTSQIINAHETTLLGCKIGTFLDLRAAYDTVVYRKLAKKISDRGGGGRDLSLISSLMFEDCFSILTVNHLSHEQAIPKKHGLFQGSVLAPLLFNIYIDDLGRELATHDRMGEAASLLFADDIKIGTRKHGLNQQLVSVCARWARENGMQFNIAKCGTVGSTEPVVLEDKLIPLVNSYKYLGADHTKQGIDFITHLQKRADNVLKFLRAQDATRAWPYWAKLYILKTFGISQMNFLLDVTAVFVARQSAEVQESCKKIIDKVRRASFEFLFGTGGQGVSQTVLESITALWSVDFMLVYLRANLAIQLEHLDEGNMINDLKSDVFLALNPKSVVHLASRSKELLSYRVEMIPLNTENRVTFKTWLMRQQLNCWQISGKLLAYIGNSQRQAGSRTDIIFHRERAFANSAFRWRVNRLFFGRICKCKLRFNRGHIDRCGLLGNHQEYVEMENSIRFKKAKLLIKNRFSDEHYTVLDECLNLSMVESFKSMVLALDAALS